MSRSTYEGDVQDGVTPSPNDKDAIIVWGVFVFPVHIRQVAKMSQNKYADSFGDGFIKAVAVNMCGGSAGLLAALVY